MLMTMKTKIPVLLLSLLWSAGYAQQTLQDEFLAALRANNTQIETIGCDFTQLKHNSLPCSTTSRRATAS